MKHNPPKPLLVSGTTDPSKLGGALAASIRENGASEVQAIGAQAVNQAVKGIAIARGHLAPAGLDIVAVPGMIDVQVDGEERTAIRFHVTPRYPVSPDRFQPIPFVRA